MYRDRGQKGATARIAGRGGRQGRKGRQVCQGADGYLALLLPSHLSRSVPAPTATHPPAPHSQGAAYTLEYIKEAVAEADAVTRLTGLMKQRRRWLNGTFFAMLYALGNMGRIWTESTHSLGRKLLLTFEFMYLTVNLIVGTWCGGRGAGAEQGGGQGRGAWGSVCLPLQPSAAPVPTCPPPPPPPPQVWHWHFLHAALLAAQGGL